MAIGSHWQTRFDHPTVSETDPNEAAKVSERRRAIEEIALSFLLAIFTVLVSVSASEVEDSLAAQAALQDDSALATDDEPRADEERDGTLALAQRITAVVRRILPSLRILSRWLKSHLEYIARASSSSNPELRATITTFWTEYKRLMLGLARLFPLIQLPGLDEPLEEDLDMRGFLPLRRGHAVSGSGNPEEFNGESPGRQEVHPNEEQLMRISDLLVDVKLLMQTEVSLTRVDRLTLRREVLLSITALPCPLRHSSRSLLLTRRGQCRSALRPRTIQSTSPCALPSPKVAVSETNSRSLKMTTKRSSCGAGGKLLRSFLS